ncbi:hypothetical protein COOONC_04480 [Cooperia oncophora]
MAFGSVAEYFNTLNRLIDTATIMQTFNKEVLQKKKEVNWFIPIFHQLCRDLLNIAKMADELTEKDDEVENISSYYEQSANYIMEAYRTCTSDVRADPSTTKKIAILNMTNQLFRIYFKPRNRYRMRFAIVLLNAYQIND